MYYIYIYAQASRLSLMFLSGSGKPMKIFELLRPIKRLQLLLGVQVAATQFWLCHNSFAEKTSRDSQVVFF